MAICKTPATLHVHTDPPKDHIHTASEASWWLDRAIGDPPAAAPSPMPATPAGHVALLLVHEVGAPGGEQAPDVVHGQLG